MHARRWRIADVFHFIDVDGSGGISSIELREALRRWGILGHDDEGQGAVPSAAHLVSLQQQRRDKASIAAREKRTSVLGQSPEAVSARPRREALSGGGGGGLGSMMA